MRLKRFLRKFRYNPKRSFMLMFLFFALVSLTVGYAFLTTSVSIEGVSKMAEVRWDIHFDNLDVTDGSVVAEDEATIVTPTSISFSAQLANPGDFYEFTVDVVNEGTLNAMIDSVSILPVLTAEQQEYLEYTMTYLNGAPLAPKQRLDVNDSETIIVRFSYRDGLDPEDYPITDQELEISVEIVYVQADGTEEDITCQVTCPEGTYLPANSCTCVPCEAGNACPGGEYDLGGTTQGTSTCGSGTYSEAGSDACIDCPAGSYSTTTGATSCTLCPTGSYQNEEGQTVCKVCSSGKTSNAGATATCTTNCSNSANVSTWNTPAWSNNAVSNHCSIATCASGYGLASDNVCRQQYTVTFNYNKASWNTNTTRKCTPEANGKCNVTGPGIPGLSGTTNNAAKKPLSQLFNYLGWSSSSSATSATYGPTASIQVSGNTTLYAVVTPRSSVTIKTNDGDGVKAYNSPGGGSIGYGPMENTTLTLADFSYTSGSHPLWLKIIDSQCTTAISSNEKFCWFHGEYTTW